jgi:hypothetical protein
MFERLTEVEIHFENRTSLPVYEWSVQTEEKELRLSSDTEGPIVPGHTSITKTSKEWLSVLQETIPRVELIFQAANGERLQRRFDGNIEVLSDRLLGSGE